MPTRQFNLTLRAATDTPEAEGIIEGRAVPYETETEIIPGFREVFARDSVTVPDRGLPMYYRHKEPVGVWTDWRSEPDGFYVRGKVSDTALGRDALTLVRDGAITRLSVGFVERKWRDEESPDGGLLRTQLEAELHEVSLVPIPAYDDAEITGVRERKETPMPDTTTTATDELRADLGELARQVEALTLATAAARPATPTADGRSAGALLKAAVKGEAAARDALEAAHARAFTGGVLADGLGTEDHPAGLIDLVRLVEAQNALAAEFATGPLPATGSHLEFARLKDDTTQVAKQAKEGDKVAMGKVSVQTATTPIETYAGGATLSRQAIERSPVNVLDLTLRAMAMKAGRQAADGLSVAFEAAVKAQGAAAITAGKALSALKWADFPALLVDAAMKFADQGMTLDALIVTPAAFKTLAALTDTNERPLLEVAGTGSNTVGTLAALDLAIDLSGLRIRPNLRATSNGMGENTVGAFVNRAALRRYASPITRLQDGDIFTLTNDFSLYYYEAIADEMPTGLVPFKTA